MRMWWAPGRGASSIIRTPACFSSAMRSSIPSTVKATWCNPSPRYSKNAATVLAGSVGSSSSSRTSWIRKKQTRTFWSGTSSMPS